MKEIQGVYDAPAPHWVGDGFPVRSLFSYDRDPERLSPFLLLDYAGPKSFDSAARPRGVGSHPHRGFETVTIVYQGEVAHRDSSGGGGIIGPGDVQWMTAGSGIVHEEFHSTDFTRRGGELEMVQLWVNLPAADKMTAPRYQAISASDIPVVQLADGAGRVRVIAGEFRGHSGAAHTFSPVDVWDVRLSPGKRTVFSVPEGRSLLIAVLAGTVQFNDREIVRGVQMVVLDSTGRDFAIEANTEAKLLVLSGEPLQEPVVGYGPFVMSSREQIRQAIDDFNGGRFGQHSNSKEVHHE